jgi:hypothetical protein
MKASARAVGHGSDPSARRRDADLSAAAEDLAHEVTPMGRHDDAARAIDAWFAAGADSVHLVLPPGRPERELAEVIDTAAGIVASRPPPTIIEEDADSLFTQSRYPAQPAAATTRRGQVRASAGHCRPAAGSAAMVLAWPWLAD